MLSANPMTTTTERDALIAAPDILRFRLLRHGGRRTDRWREVKTDQPFTKYDKMRKALRQGGLRLVRGDTIVAETSAPRLRTRW